MDLRACAGEYVCLHMCMNKCTQTNHAIDIYLFLNSFHFNRLFVMLFVFFLFLRFVICCNKLLAIFSVLFLAFAEVNCLGVCVSARGGGKRFLFQKVIEVKIKAWTQINQTK